MGNSRPQETWRSRECSQEQGVFPTHVDPVSLRPHLDEGRLLSLTSSPLWPGIPGGPGRPGLPGQPGSPSLWSPWERGIDMVGL